VGTVASNYSRFAEKRTDVGIASLQLGPTHPRQVASLVNLFLRSSGLDWMISIIGVGVFAGLTAYDTQRIKGMHDRGDDATSAGRKAVMGALSLYLNFINLFMMLLRLMGGDAKA
jgi:FtsH-binding integral membrane protein